MAKRKHILLPKSRRILSEVGENIRLARLRRKLSTAQIAERANISRTTLYAIEKGMPNVSIGNYFSVLIVLGLEKDFLLIGRDDELGRKIQDAGLKTPNRAPKREKDE
ncbi:MAG: helix-turn-helix transcriptional regulator [Bacteroidales bacterium]